MRLTKAEKDELITRIVDLKMKAREEAFQKDLEKFIDEVAKHYLGIPDSILKVLPKGALPQCSRFRIYIHNDEILNHTMPKSYPAQACMESYGRATIKLDRKGDVQSARDLAKEKKGMDAERANLRQLTMQIIYACSSTEKLLKTWPEVTQIVKINTSVAQPTSLVPTVKKLNEAMGFVK